MSENFSKRYYSKLASSAARRNLAVFEKQNNSYENHYHDFLLKEEIYSEKISPVSENEYEYLDPENDCSIVDAETIENAEIELRNKLAQWALNHSMTTASTNELLEILTEFGLNLPKTKDSLIDTIEKDLIEYEELSDTIEPPNKISKIDTDNDTTTISHSSQLKNLELKYVATQLELLQIEIIRNNKLINHFCLEENELYRLFPIKNNEELADINKKIVESDDFFINDLILILSKYAPSDKFCNSGVASIMTDDLLFHFNWDGQQNKKPCKDMLLFNKILYEAWKFKLETFKEYEKCVKKQIAAAHNRYNQKKTRERRVLGSFLHIEIPKTRKEISYSRNETNNSIQKISTSKNEIPKIKNEELYFTIETSKEFSEIVNINKMTERNTEKRISHPSQLQSMELKFVATKIELFKMEIVKNNKLINNYCLENNKIEIEFPIRSFDELEEINEKLIENKDFFMIKLISRLSKYAPTGKFCNSGIARIMADDILFQFNWDGQQNKKPAKELLLFNKVLFEAWKFKLETFNEYEKSIKKQISAAHNRVHQKTTRYNMSKNK